MTMTLAQQQLIQDARGSLAAARLLYLRSSNAV
jgi:hypothetical protein